MTRSLHQQIHEFSINIDETHCVIVLIKQQINLTFCVSKITHKKKMEKYRKIFYGRLISGGEQTYLYFVKIIHNASLQCYMDSL